MHVGHLLQLDGLGLDLVWAEDELLSREIGGVTATDLEDPARFLQSGEIVLSGLVWWAPGDGRGKIDRFVSALRGAGVSALLAGEETHGAVPGELAASCREHRVALLAVPARTTFRAVTEAVYLRRWGDLSRSPSVHYALPGGVRAELGRLIDRGAGLDELLERAFAHLGPLAGHLLTATGRTVARTPGAPPLPPDRAAAVIPRASSAPGGPASPVTTLRVRAEAGTPYDTWYLHVPGAAEAPPRVLHEIADVLAQYRQALTGRHAVRRRAAGELVRLLAAPAPDPEALAAALAAAGLPGDGGPYRLVVAEAAERAERAERAGTAERAETAGNGEPLPPTGAEKTLTERTPTEGALAEALALLGPVAFAVAPAGRGEAVAVVRTDPEADAGTPARLAALWPLVLGARPEVPLYAGVSLPVAEPGALSTALSQARYARDAARATAPETGGVRAADELTTLPALLTGMPTAVREVFSARTLGPLLDGGSPGHATLMRTLEAFLAHNCSWARTAEALHLHVNTVHYRIRRIQDLTGRDLTRLDHKLDLYAALLCR